MSALEKSPVPCMLHLYIDSDVIGTEFYVMEMVEGRVFKDTSLPEYSADKRRQPHDSFIHA